MFPRGGSIQTAHRFTRAGLEAFVSFAVQGHSGAVSQGCEGWLYSFNREDNPMGFRLAEDSG